ACRRRLDVNIVVASAPQRLVYLISTRGAYSSGDRAPASGAGCGGSNPPRRTKHNALPREEGRFLMFSCGSLTTAERLTAQRSVTVQLPAVPRSVAVQLPQARREPQHPVNPLE